MAEARTSATVTIPVDGVGIVAIEGQITGFSEGVLMEAYTEATDEGAKAIILDFAGLEYMNSSGIGLLVTILIRTQRAKQRLFAAGLTDHYREIFQLTRLDEAIGIYDDAAAAVAAATGGTP